MSLQAKTILNLIAGAVAGLLAWALTELTGWFSVFLRDQHSITPYNPQLLLYGGIFGLVLGLLLGIVEAMSLDSQRQMWISLALGGVVGFAGGAIGLSGGETVWGLITSGTNVNVITPANFFLILFGRAAGYGIVGLLVGAAQGLSRRSVVIARQGAFGGFIGGFVGGMCFQIMAALLNSPSLARLAALAATGALVGFFVGLVQNLFKQAWIRVVLGRNEGKEYLLAKPITTIGRSELSDIGLYGDPQIAPTHAVIEAIPAQKRHRLRHVAEAGGRGGPFPPTFVNGQPVAAEQWLADGDTIQIARRTLLFQEKATRGAAPVPRTAPAPPELGPASHRSAEPTRYIGQELTQQPPASTFTAAYTSTPPELGAGGRSAPPELVTVVMAPAEATVVMPPQTGGIGTRLVCTAGPYSGQSFPLGHSPLTLGRAADCDIALTADTLISRRQAEIAYAEGRHRLRDLGSSNGTLVNGRRLTDTHPLSAGDTLQAGDTTLRYE